ncbi:hypothetical protein [Desulfobacter curvatus]|uniref:hypothetical protein n=1 Tax=Desulfobacter curvatus TaxID=2290 RepID=UPI000361FE6A|nr:hypothetical protein [Desulfobacter curvatus]
MATDKDSNIAIGGSNIATGGSKIATGGSGIFLKKEKKKSFIKGFLSGVLASLTASGLIYLIKVYSPLLVNMIKGSK